MENDISEQIVIGWFSACEVLTMKASIYLYLISGFLGSGKTTFLTNLLEQNSNQRVGIIVNEFGSVSIDGKVLNRNGIDLVEITNGSIFCACLKADFTKTLFAFLEEPIDILFIEASGLSDPSSMKNLLEQLNEFSIRKSNSARTYDYKGSTCLVDAKRFLDFYEVLQPLTNQVRKSSLIIVNKTDEASSEQLMELHNKLTELNPRAYIFDTSFGKVPLSLFENSLSPYAISDDETINTPWNRPSNYILDLTDTYELNSMKSFANKLSSVTLRFKGFFKTPNGQIAHADCVGNFIRISYDLSFDQQILDSLKIVLIARDNCDYTSTIQEAWSLTFPDKSLILCRYD